MKYTKNIVNITPHIPRLNTKYREILLPLFSPDIQKTLLDISEGLILVLRKPLHNLWLIGSLLLLLLQPFLVLIVAENCYHTILDNKRVETEQREQGE